LYDLILNSDEFNDASDFDVLHKIKRQYIEIDKPKIDPVLYDIFIDFLRVSKIIDIEAGLILKIDNQCI